MRKNNYLWLFLFVILTFLSMVLMLPENTELFVQQIYLIMFLLIIAGLGLYAVACDINYAWMLLGLLFATTLMNTFYLNYAVEITTKLFIVSILIGITGFLISISGIKKPVKKKIPKTIIINSEPEQETAEIKTAAKATTKKRTYKRRKKKAAKATTKKRTYKKRKKKAAKTTTKKRTYKKRKSKTTKVTTKKRTYKKRTKKATTKKVSVK